MYCTRCGNAIPDGARFCTKCGNPAVSGPEQVREVHDEVHETVKEPEFESKTLNVHAPVLAGEAFFGTVDVNRGPGAAAVLGPGTVIANGFRSLISSLASFFKDPKKLIPAAVLAGLWLIINLLQAFGLRLLPVEAFSFLSFARGGLSGGIAGAVGGIIGKGMFAGAVVSLIGTLTNRNREKRSFGQIISGAFGVSLDSLWAYLTGIGAAMLFYLFISGGAVRSSFMGGIAVSFLAAKAALGKGFLQSLIASFTSKGRQEAGPGVTGFIRGIAAGSAASALIGLTGIRLILIIAGSVLAVGGVIMMILQATGVVKMGKEAQIR